MKNSLSIKILPLVVTVLLVSFLIKKIGIEKLASIPSQINPTFLILAALLDIPFVLLKSYKWHRIALVSFPEMKYKDAVSSFLIGLGASLFTPLRLGELARAAAFKRRKTEALALAFVDKLIDVTGLGLLAAITLFWLNWNLGIAVFSALTVLIAFLCIYIYSTKSSKVIGHLPFFSYLLKVKEAIIRLRPSLILSFIFLSIVSFFIIMLQFYVIMKEFAKISFISVVIGLPIIIAGSMLPVSIAGLGVREMIAEVVMGRFFITEEKAVAASFLLFLVNGLMPGLVGIIIGTGKISKVAVTQKPKSS